MENHKQGKLETEFNKLWYSMRRYYVDEFFLRQALLLDRKQTVLDLGGHKFNKRGVFDIDDYGLSVYYANLVPQKGADFLADASQVPIRDASFGTVICAELLEHVPRPDHVLKEAYRVLQADGKLLISVPYLYPTHGDPYDYGRYTDYYWRENLEAIGFRDIHIEKQGLFWSVLLDMIRDRAYQRYKVNKNFAKTIARIVRRLKRFARHRDATSGVQEDAMLNRYTTGFGIVCHKPTHSQD